MGASSYQPLVLKYVCEGGWGRLGLGLIVSSFGIAGRAGEGLKYVVSRERVGL